MKNRMIQSEQMIGRKIKNVKHHENTLTIFF
jgi:hypothetical protein